MNTNPQKLIRLVAGLALLAPAVLVGLAGLGWPTLATFYLSLQKQNLVSPAQFVGGQNFSRLLADKAFASALANTFGLLVERLLVAGVVPVLLGLAVSRFGRGVRWAVRLLFTIPLAMFAPVAVALVWLQATSPGSGIFGGAAWFANPSRAASTLRLIDALYTYGLACAAGTVTFVGAMRRPEGSTATSKKPLVAAWLVSLSAVTALTLQDFTLSYALTGGGPAGSTTLLALYQFSLAFRFLQLGAGAAVASLTLVLLAVLGLAAGLIVVLAGLQFELGPWRASPAAASDTSQPRQSRAGTAWLLGVILVVSLAAGVVGAGPALASSLRSLGASQAYPDLFARLPLASVVVNTLVPAVIIIVIQVPVAYLAALGIGAIRPLGRWSEALLLPVSPWLFVSAVPLSLVAFQGLQQLHFLNTVVALVPPVPLSVPMLFVLTLFFKGHAARWHSARAQGQSAAGAVWSQLIWPSLPLVLLLAALAALICLQDLYWPLVAASQPNAMPYSVALLRLASQNANGPLLSAGITLFEVPIFVLFFVALGALQCLYLDRLALSSGAAQ